MDPKLDVATPERVSVCLPIAGIGSRAIAYLVDLGLLFCGLMVLFFVSSLLIPDIAKTAEALSGIGRAVSGLVLFTAIWGYWTGMEVAWRGQTVGKKVLRIRVVKSDGSPIGVFESAVRNLVRAIDFLPLGYAVGLISMLVDSRHRRLGDLLAGTMLVREEKIDLGRYATATASRLSAADVEVLTGFLARFDTLEPRARLKVGGQLVVRHGGQVALNDPLAIRAFLQDLTKGG